MLPTDPPIALARPPPSAEVVNHGSQAHAGMAVQRYDRLVLNQYPDGSKYIIELENFYDEAQIMVRSDKVPAEVVGGTFEQVTSNLFLIQATSDVITITYSE